MSSFGIAVREGRLRLNLTLKELATSAGISESYLSRIENAQCAPPKSSVVKKLAEILGEDIEAFLILAQRVDQDFINSVRERAPELRSMRNLMSFLDSFLKLNDNPLGGIEGVIELLVGESLKRGETLSGTQTTRFMMKVMRQLSKQKDGRLPAEIVQKQKQGRVILEALSKLKTGSLQDLQEIREEILEYERPDNDKDNSTCG